MSKVTRFTKTIYARKPGSPTGQGVEVLPSYKDTQKDEDGKVVSREGRVTLRFFKFTETAGKTSRTSEIRFVMDPVEAHVLSRKIAEIGGLGGKYFTSPHKFTNEAGVKTESKVGVEKWGDPGAGGYAIQIFKGDERINVAMNMDYFLYLGDLLKAASMGQSHNEWFGETRQQ